MDMEWAKLTLLLSAGHCDVACAFLIINSLELDVRVHDDLLHDVGDLDSF